MRKRGGRESNRGRGRESNRGRGSEKREREEREW